MSAVFLFLLREWVPPFALLCVLSWWLPKMFASWTWVHSDKQAFWMVMGMALPALFFLGAAFFAFAEVLWVWWGAEGEATGALAFLAVVITAEIWGPIAVFSARRELKSQRQMDGDWGQL